MNKLLVLGFMGLMFSISASANCGLHIINLKNYLKNQREQTITLKQMAQKKNFALKIDLSEVKDGDVIIDKFITTDHEGNSYLPSEVWYKERWALNYYYTPYQISERIGSDYTKDVIIMESQNGTLNDVAVLKTEFKIKYTEVERKYGKKAMMNLAMDNEAIDNLLSSIPHCKK